MNEVEPDFAVFCRACGRISVPVTRVEERRMESHMDEFACKNCGARCHGWVPLAQSVLALTATRVKLEDML